MKTKTALKTTAIAVATFATLSLTGGVTGSATATTPTTGVATVGSIDGPAIPKKWTAATNKAYAKKIKDRDVYQYLKNRAQNRKKGERLGVVLGLDHVASYDGTRVDATYKFVKMAQKYGYQVHFITGSGLARAQNLLGDAGITNYQSIQVCSGKDGDEVMARCKGNYRTYLKRNGLTLVANVGAHVPAWKYGAQGERTIKLKY